MAPPFPDWDYNLGLGVGGGTADLIGQAQDSDQGIQATVVLYPNGRYKPPGITVLVEILGMLDTETVPDGTWITGIQKFTDADNNVSYQADLPLWLG